MQYEIQTGVNNPILRKVSDPIERIDQKIKNFGDALMYMMLTHDGVGLAAPQLGVNIRMIATTQWNKKQDKILAQNIMINPKIVEVSKKMELGDEGCLSLPNVFGRVERYTWVTISFQGLDGKIYTKKYKGFDGVIVQHELDHLDGILFVDKAIEED